MTEESTTASTTDAVAPTYVVVGAGPGIGLQTAKAFAGRGWRTVLVGRTLANLANLVWHRVKLGRPLLDGGPTCKRHLDLDVVLPSD